MFYITLFNLRKQQNTKKKKLPIQILHLPGFLFFPLMFHFTNQNNAMWTSACRHSYLQETAFTKTNDQEM